MVTPVIIEGKEHYVMLVYPRIYYLLKVMTARTKWYHAQWIKRYNHWRASRGESPYQEAEAEIGSFEGVRFKETA